ncbi:YcnI family protein [Trujillonella humicola]|uniref:YcnI family copper-binding membrane protein n=1 Tax=Trujillonella humicola TaxID=3383699 RepID=UPI00390676A5
MSPFRPLARLGVVVPAVLAALAASVVLAGGASAHVTVSSPDAEPGGYATLTFRVPNESDTASTVSLRVQLPTDTPLVSVSTRPVPGWTVTATRSELPEPVDVEGTPVGVYVSRLEWRAEPGAGIAPGQFQEFAIAAGPLPDTGELVLPAVQTYSDGTESAWIEPTVEGQAEPERPAPVLALGAGAGDGPAASADGHGDDDATGDAGASGLALFVAILALFTGLAGVVLGYRAGRRTVSS